MWATGADILFSLACRPASYVAFTPQVDDPVDLCAAYDVGVAAGWHSRAARRPI